MTAPAPKVRLSLLSAAVAAAALLAGSSGAFVPVAVVQQHPTPGGGAVLAASSCGRAGGVLRGRNGDDYDYDGPREGRRHLGEEVGSPSSATSPSGRRGFFRNAAASSLAIATAAATAAAATGRQQRLLMTPPAAFAADDMSKKKVLVLGGTGFVGSRVVDRLKLAGVDVVATSTDGRDNTVALDITSDAASDAVKKLSQGCDAVVSCVGAIGTDVDEAVNAGTGFAAVGAKAAGVGSFVYITVAPEVREFAKDIDFLKGYMAGKAFSRETVLKSYGTGGAVLIEPTFIYGAFRTTCNKWHHQYPPELSQSIKRKMLTLVLFFK